MKQQKDIQLQTTRNESQEETKADDENVESSFFQFQTHTKVTENKCSDPDLIKVLKPIAVKVKQKTSGHKQNLRTEF